MLLRTLISFVLILMTVMSLLAQEAIVLKSDSLVKIDGKEFIIHTVEPRQTLFSIARTYEVKLSSIVFDNPGIMDGIQPGQHLKIGKNLLGETVVIEKAEKELELDGQYVLYEVPAKKTLYAISKEYNTTISALLDANPELAEGLKVGSTIRIPIQNMLHATNTEKVDMVGLPDMLRPVDASSGALNVVLMIPLYYVENDTIEARRTIIDPEKIYERSEMGLHFYEGVLLAVDSLNRLGFNINLKVIDTENRPWKIQQLAKTPELKNADLVIGPFYSKVFEAAAKFCYEHCIPIVSPTIQGKSVIAENPYVFKVTPSTERMVADLGRSLSMSDSTNNIIIHYGRPDEQVLLWRFRQGLGNGGVGSFPAYNIYKTPKDSVRSILSLTKRNNLVVLSENEVSAASLVRNLSKWSEDAYVVVYVPDSWMRFKSLDLTHFDRLRMHLPKAFFVDYENIETQLFVQKFRRIFKTEPSTFAFRGYDIAMHFIPNLEGMQDDGPDHMLSVKETGLQSDFDWSREEDEGYENVRCRIVDYTGLNLKIATD